MVVDVVAQSTQRAGSAATLAHTRFVHAPTFPAIQVHVLQPSNHALHLAGHCLDESCNLSHITALAQRASHAFEYVSPSAHLTGSNARGHAFAPLQSSQPPGGGAVVVVVGGGGAHPLALAQPATHGLAYVRLSLLQSTGAYSLLHLHVPCCPTLCRNTTPCVLMGAAVVPREPKPLFPTLMRSLRPRTMRASSFGCSSTALVLCWTSWSGLHKHLHSPPGASPFRPR